jgi:CRISPR-associated protein Csx10
VDREVIFSKTGLPYIPARRLKGLLRDAFRDVTSILKLQGSGTEFEKIESHLFGGIGQSFSGVLRFCNATLCDPQTLQPEPTLEPWLASILSSQSANSDTDRVIHREEIIHEFTELRRQTRIGRKKGVASENTLRVTRVLRSGLAFRASINTSCKLSRDTEHMLALGVSGLQQLGSSRTRGLGHVRCRLFSDQIDLTADAIAALRADKLNAPELTVPQSSTVSAQIASPAGLAVLRFRLTLKQPAIFPSSEGDPNMMASLNYIPGSSLHGWLAWRFLENYEPDEVFLNLFCRGGLRFLPAYPEMVNGSGNAVRSLPAPFALQEQKRTPGAYRNLLVAGDWTGVSRLRKKWILPDEAFYQKKLAKLEVATEFHYHHARPAADRRLGRAVGIEQAPLYDLKPGNEGAVFTYEQISAGTTFIGSILGDRSALLLLRSLLGEQPPNAILGRSRSGQYGGDASWQWLDPSAIDCVTNADTEWSAIPDFSDANEVLVCVLSPTITLNSSGHPVAEFPVTQFQTVSRLQVSSVKTTFARAAWSSSYLTHQRLPRQQLPCIEPGSIFHLQLARTYTADELKAAVSHVAAASFGLRTEQGNGRLMLLPLSNFEGDITFTNRQEQASGPFPCPRGSSQWNLAQRVYSRRLEAAVITDAFAVASDHRTHVQSLTPSLLLRLAELVETDCQGLRSKLSLFRQRARDRFTACTIHRKPFLRHTPSTNGHSSAQTLDELICDLAENSKDYYRILLSACFNPQGWNKIFGPQDPLQSDTAICDKLIRLYITTVLNGIAWKLRDERRRSNGEGDRS